MRTRLYIAGPCTGIPDHNYPLFNRVQSELVAAGYVVHNPARNTPLNPAPCWADYMRMSVAQVLMCDGVAVLPGWQDSPGASLEVKLAYDLGVEHRAWEWWRDQMPATADITALVNHYPGTERKPA